MESCGQAESNPIHKKIVDQIVAVDNFVAFKKLMCKRNAELNKQAIAMMDNKEEGKENPVEKVTGEKEKGKEATPAGAKPGAKGKIDKDMAEALKVAQELERQEEEEFMRKAIEESKKLEEQ